MNNIKSKLVIIIIFSLSIVIYSQDKDNGNINLIINQIDTIYQTNVDNFNKPERDSFSNKYAKCIENIEVKLNEFRSELDSSKITKKEYYKLTNDYLLNQKRELNKLAISYQLCCVNKKK
jgi:hypothetical protein